MHKRNLFTCIHTVVKTEEGNLMDSRNWDILKGISNN